jgi:hypothetical protein
VISQLNSDFDHMFGLVNGFCDQKSEQSELNWPIDWMLIERWVNWGKLVFETNCATNKK